jgi:hypothetical protein
MPSFRICGSVALVRTDVSEEFTTSIIMATRIGELGTTLAVTSNRSTQRPTLAIYCYRCSWFSDSSYPDNGDDTFLRNAVSYKSHMA